MWVEATDNSIKVILNEEEVENLYSGEPVIGVPSSVFPLGEKILVIQKEAMEKTLARMKKGGLHEETVT
jgi:hypothetical protein